jgi:hypothetical protein
MTTLAQAQSILDKAIAASSGPLKALLSGYGALSTAKPEKLIEVVTLLKQLGHTIDMPQYQPVKRIIRFDPDTGAFCVPTNVREADYDEVVYMLESTYSLYTVPNTKAYRYGDIDGGISVPFKWQWWRALYTLQTEFHYTFTQEAAAKFRAFMSVLNTKSLRVVENDQLLVECIPDLRLYDSMFGKWDNDRFAKKVKAAMHGIISRDTGKVGLLVDKYRWDLSDIEYIKAEFNFTEAEGFWDNPYVKLLVRRRDVYDRLNEMARSAVPNEKDDLLPAIAAMDLNGHKLYTHQVAGVQWAVAVMDDPNHKGVMIIDKVGVGKTATAIAIAKWRGASMLVVPPANLVSNWINELKTFMGLNLVYSTRPADEDGKKMLSAIRSMHLAGTADALLSVTKRAILSIDGEKAYDWVWDIAPYFGAVILPHSVLTKWVDGMARYVERANDTVICFDEADAFKDSKSARGAAYRKLAGVVKWSNATVRVVVMTATPHRKELGDMFPHLNMCYPRNSYSSSQGVFSERYNARPEGIFTDFGGYMLFRVHRQIPDMPVADWITATTMLPQADKERYDLAMAAIAKYISQRFGGVVLKLPFYTYLRQLIGRIKGQAVMAAIKQRLTDDPKKTLILAHHHKTLNMLASAFGTKPITSAMPKPRRDATIAAFNAASNGVLVAGVTLAAGWNGLAEQVIVAELPWAWATIEQSTGRALRVNNPFKDISIYMSVAQGTIEEKLWDVVQGKKDESDAILYGYELPIDDDVAVDAILFELFPGIDFVTAPNHGDTVIDMSEIARIVNGIIGDDEVAGVAPENTYTYRVQERMSKRAVDMAMVDVAAGVQYAAIDVTTQEEVQLFVCHADATGAIDTNNLQVIMANKDNASFVVACCYPGLAADRYNIRTVCDHADVIEWAADGKLLIFKHGNSVME